MKTVISYAIDSFQSLQINMLDVLIPDGTSLMKTSKEVYLKKVNCLFNFLSINNYLNLNFIKIESLNDVYTFYTFDYKYSFSVLIKLNKEGEAIADFEVLDESIKILVPFLQDSTTLKVIVFKDDCLEFVPTNKCIQQTKIYLNAINEFSNLDSISFNNVEIIEDWINNYEELYDSINPNKLQYAAHYLFFKLYNFFLDVLTVVELKSDIIMANEMFANINILSTTEKNDWLQQFEYILLETAVLQQHNIISREDKANSLIQIQIFENFYLLFELEYFNDFLIFNNNIKIIQEKNLISI